MEEAIEKYFSDMKLERIKNKTSANMTDDQKAVIALEAEEKFLLDNWLPDAAKRSGQLSVSSHPCKFSHPNTQKHPDGSKTSSTIAVSKRNADGYLRTGNVDVLLDALGSSGAKHDVYKYLMLKLSDGRSIMEHLEIESSTIKEELRIGTASFDEMKDGLLAIKKSHGRSITSEKTKQVFFPVDDDYHLLSILTPSGLIYELRNRIQDILFSEQVKEARDDRKKRVYNETGFNDLFGLSMIGYGGTKPQNISVLNSTVHDKKYKWTRCAVIARREERACE